MRVMILTSPDDIAARPDTDDTLIQAEEIATCLRRLDHEPAIVPFELNRTISALDGFNPEIVFNLVEDVPEGPDQVHLATEFLDGRGVPYTGASTTALRRLGRKPAMRARLRDAGLLIPPGLGEAGTDARLIVKSATEHSSIGLSADNVVLGTGAAMMMIARRQAELGGEWFAEAYIDGREFNVALLDGPDGPTTLPIAEILFTAHSADTPKIVGYAEKWDTQSPAYLSTPRSFPAPEQPLFSELERLSRAAWDAFDLTGYARVDFRVDRAGRPYILEINANPCLAADAGFCAAAARLGLSQTDVVARLLQSALHRQDTLPPRA
jgi:D-alanine-D-alanine ligase